MTEADIHNDLDRFREYLLANGVRIIALAIHMDRDNATEDMLTVGGSYEMLNELSIRTMAHTHGLKLVTK